jgi:class I fructose-bisphosphate aldolase
MVDSSRITTKGKAVFLAYDHGMEHGPSDFNDKNVDPEFILNIAYEAKLNAVVLQKGVAEKYWQGKYRHVSLILKLNGKVNIQKGEPYPAQNCSVEEAKRLGASAVGYTIFLGSERDWEMIERFGKIVEEAHREGLAAIAWVYPRGKAVKDETSPEITAYAARVALELGADMAKIKYCGSEECFRWVVQSAGRCKVVLSGGPKTEKFEEFLETVSAVMRAGAAGVAVGRNVWQQDDPIEAAKKIKEIVFEASSR